jgi:hypothetical protein
MIGGSGCYLIIGGHRIPVTDVSIEVGPAPTPTPGWLRMPPDGSFKATVTWDVIWWDLDALVAELESLRWSAYLARQFKDQPGFRFADLMRGVERN